MKRAAILLVGLLIAASAQAERTPPRRVAVAQFDAPSDSHARNAVLATLSEHDDIEVVSLEDIAFAGKRLKSDPAQTEGRAKISAELGIDVWIDGKVDGTDAELRMTSVADARVVQVEVHAAATLLLEQLVGERMWAAMGPKLSERERGRRAQLAQAELARNKIAAREAELTRQVGLAHQRDAEHVQRLKAEQSLATKKRAAFLAELSHQKQLVEDRLASEVAEQQKVAEAHRQAEMRRLAQVAAAHQIMVRQPAPVAYAAPAQSTQWGSTPPSGSYHGAPPAGQTWNAQPAPAAPGQVSSSTQRWLESQQQAGLPSAVAAPPPQPGFAANAPSGVSPATQHWLEQQQHQ
jgi:hypothetical protein